MIDLTTVNVLKIVMHVSRNSHEIIIITLHMIEGCYVDHVEIATVSINKIQCSIIYCKCRNICNYEQITHLIIEAMHNL